MRHHEGVRILLKKFPAGGRSRRRAPVSPPLQQHHGCDAIHAPASSEPPLERGAGKVLDRVGIHIGEIALHDTRKSARKTPRSSAAMDLAARPVPADGRHTLMRGSPSRTPDDDWRRGFPGLGELAWTNHGPHQLKSVPGPSASAGRRGGIVQFAPPPDTESTSVAADSLRTAAADNKNELRIPNLFLAPDSATARSARARHAARAMARVRPRVRVGKTHRARWQPRERVRLDRVLAAQPGE